MTLINRQRSGISEIFANCIDDQEDKDFKADRVHLGHVYKVCRFVLEDGFSPFGVRVSDFNNNELDQTFYLQRFTYFENILN